MELAPTDRDLGTLFISADHLQLLVSPSTLSRIWLSQHLMSART
jgi:hypothetical protein